MIKKLTLTAAVTSLMIATGANASMDPFIEKALEDVCYSAKNDPVWKLQQTMESYRLDADDVANKVVCNGMPISEFAASHNSHETAAYLGEYRDQDDLIAKN
ncbi:DUF3718 domain-containing protein [Neiella marina]|uniref:DUF3718 domain-containing protein n=1 Tax=Neiella holothuriorum TaxID=2870530 RepID=A0ABS7EFA0_9GAMM|nr:DUF3718 domain-containing protein [Neiella holothuriorum]MBW8191013.1 DUF3718 domain-containing protein [Neiella holothuriorum]